jgi:hypothetical protein
MGKMVVLLVLLVFMAQEIVKTINNSLKLARIFLPEFQA